MIQTLVELLSQKNAAAAKFRKALVDFVSSHQGELGFITFPPSSRPYSTGVVTGHEYCMYAVRVKNNTVEGWMSDSIDNDAELQKLDEDELRQEIIDCDMAYWSDIDLDIDYEESELLEALEAAVATETGK